MLVIENDVVLMDIENEPGSLGKLARDCSEAGVNIEYTYCTAAAGQESALLVLRTRDCEKAVEALS
jgi:hypothetical protein